MLQKHCFKRVKRPLEGLKRYHEVLPYSGGHFLLILIVFDPIIFRRIFDPILINLNRADSYPIYGLFQVSPTLLAHRGLKLKNELFSSLFRPADDSENL